MAEKIGFILEKADTLIGKAGRLFTGYPYTHIACTFDMIDFYSFSRHHYNDPFDSGFMKESKACYAYKNDVQMKIYWIEIDEDIKEKIIKFNESIYDLPFDIYGMIKMPFGIYRKKDNAYNCMSYIAKVMELCDITLRNQPYYRNNIQDLENALIDKGIKSEYVIFSHEYDEEFMKHISFKQKIRSFIDIHKRLFGIRK